jgi:osmotically-inducible protein OsmY
MKQLPLLPLTALCLLSACSPLGLAGGAVVGTGMAASREGGITGTLSDTRIHAEIADLWFKYNLSTFSKLGITVDQGRVLLTGVVQKPEHRVEAVRLAWQVRGVKQVINEIRVANGEGLPGYVRDRWITTRLRTQMTFDDVIANLNYSIDTVQGTVYVMGTAQTQAELDRVVRLARTIPNVRQVVSYIRLAHDPVRTGSNSTRNPSPAPTRDSDHDTPFEPSSGSWEPENSGLRPDETGQATGPAVPLMGPPGRPTTVTAEPLR